jgi:lipopolysaccharide transport system permease protein
MQQVVIKPNSNNSFNLKELINYRELFYFLVWRDVKVRYKQTVLGMAWAILRPVFTMVIFTFIFNRLAGFESGNVPYPLFVLSGVIIWNFFSEGMSASTQSLVNNAGLISKTYFPRVIIPLTSVLRGLIDFLIGIALYLILCVFFGFAPGFQILLLPVVILLLFIVSSSLGILFSAYSVKYRDIAQILPFFIQLLTWISPVGYSSSKIPAQYEMLYWLNPMVGIIELGRYCLLGTAHIPSHLMLISAASTLVLVVISVMSFKRLENQFADII